MRTSLTAIAAALVLVAAPSASAKPNIVVLMSDDQTLDSMSVMPRAQQLLGAEGTTFTRAWLKRE